MADDSVAQSKVDGYWTSVMVALTHQAKGEPLPEGLADKVEEAAVVLAAATLVRAGADVDAVERQFTERDYHIKLTYDGATDEVGIEVVWDDGTVTTDGMPLRRLGSTSSDD